MPGLSTNRLNSGRWVLPVLSKIVLLWQNNRFNQFPDESKGEQSPFMRTHSITQCDMMRQESEFKRAFDTYVPIRRHGLRVPCHEIFPAAIELDVKD